MGVDAALPGSGDGRLEDVGVLVAEDPVLPGVRVEPADADPLVRPAEGADERAGQVEHVVGALRGDVLDGLLQGDVGGEVEEVQVAGRQHQAEVVDAELVGEQFGVAGPLVAAGVHRRLVERRGDDAVDERPRGPAGRPRRRTGRRRRRPPALSSPTGTSASDGPVWISSIMPGSLVAGAGVGDHPDGGGIQPGPLGADAASRRRRRSRPARRSRAARGAAAGFWR